MRRFVLSVVLAVLPFCSARADYYIVVQAGNPQTSMTQREAVDLFMSRQHAFRDGEPAIVFDLARDDPDREGFYKSLTTLSLAQVNSFWSRLMFSGNSRPPQMLADETTMVDIVRRNRNALGWLAHEPVDKQLRTVLVLKDPELIRRSSPLSTVAGP